MGHAVSSKNFVRPILKFFSDNFVTIGLRHLKSRARLRRDQVEDRQDLAPLCHLGHFIFRDVKQGQLLEGQAQVGQSLLPFVEDEHEDDLKDVVDHDGADPADDVGQGKSVRGLKTAVEGFKALQVNNEDILLRVCYLELLELL